MATELENAAITFTDLPDGAEIRATGHWTVDHSAALFTALDKETPLLKGHIRIIAENMDALDTTGAWLLHRTIKALKESGATVDISGLNADQESLVKEVAAHDVPCIVGSKRHPTWREEVEDIGRATVFIWLELLRLVNYLGLVAETLVYDIAHPKRLRLTSMVYHMEQVGWKAIPIVGLMSFLIGIVIAQQGEFQLKQFGAQIFVVNLVSVSILREIAILLTAIMVAGRSGSAFTAQIGSMVLHEEVDAMRTLGLDPIELLVIPRLLALVIMMPVLTFFADVMGLLGGGVYVWFAMNITPDTFIERVNLSIETGTFMVGMIKAPIFAAIIAICGCFEGMSVKGSAESVGQRTTRSVVESIFLVIVFDALFSIFFSQINL
jgi:phospholipid/cholesterol/gamma-HCH transport system permease protein